MKEIVKLRKKVGKATGVASLFLEWSEDGERKFEFLHLYLQPETNAEAKRMNKVTMQTAQTIQAQRIVQLQNEMAGIVHKSKATLKEQFDKYIGTHNLSAHYIKTLRMGWNWWEKTIGNIPLVKIGAKKMLKFSTALQNNLAPGSAIRIYNVVSTILQSAVRAGVIASNPAKMLDASEKPRGRSAEREFLTIDEVKILDATPCRSEILKKAFLFACFTGLRLSDIVTLKWEMIGDTMIQKRMIKTQETLYQPISGNARRYLPARGNDEDYVFPMKEYTQNRRDLKRWVEDAGIKKHITFHCARHTFACLLIEYNADIYTVSKLLGHSNIATTQIYAKIMDRKKEEAVNLIPDIDK